MFLFITYTCIDKDKSTILFQISLAALTFNLSIEADEKKLWNSSTFYHFIFDMSCYLIISTCLSSLGFTEINDLFNVFKEKKRMQKSPLVDIGLNFIYVACAYISSSYFGTHTCQFFYCCYMGYFLFRVHNYLHIFVISDFMKSFPMLNLNSSALTIFIVVTSLELGTVNQFLTTNLMPHEMTETRNLQKVEKYLFLIFTFSIAQSLFIIFASTTNMFAESIACHQIALTKNYPRG